jgi:glycosyltransferase involved in cell wall biosynthesis
MRLGFLIPSMCRGGAERVMSILCTKLAERGHEITLMLTEDAVNIKNTLDDRVKIVDITDSHKKFFMRVPQYIKKIKKTILNEKLDVVISFIVRTNVCAIIACKQLKIPVIISERNDPYTIPGGFLQKKIRNFIYRYSNGFVFQTEYARNYFSKKIRSRSTIILNPVSDEVSNIIACNKKENLIISVSRLFPQKNLTMLINAFALIQNQIPDYRVEIYGVGPEEDILNKLIQENGLTDKVNLMGLADDVVLRVAKAKLFVLSSNFEGLSNALIEAMCVGTACIATDSPTYGNRELIRSGENGYLVPVNDTQQLSDKMLELILNEGLNKKFSKNAKKLLEVTNSNIIVDLWESYIITIYNDYRGKHKC